MKTAFKEWAVVCRALGTGRQILILRKGGLAEQGGEFRPAHREFLLFPTGFHQSRAQVVPEAQVLWEQAEADQPPAGLLRLSHYAVLTDSMRVESFAALRKLRADHVWSDAVVEGRFHRRGDESVYVLIARVYALPSPITLPMTGHYAGCKSWVELEVDVPTAGAAPVLSDEVFADRLARIRSLLEISADA